MALDRSTGVAADEVGVVQLDAFWRAANYLSVGQIYLLGQDPLLSQEIRSTFVKPRLLGHWGTTPGLNLMYAHVNRLVAVHNLDVVMVLGPGHGGPAALANAWLDGTLGEVTPGFDRDRGGMSRLFRQFSFPRGLASHAAPDVPGSMHEGGELGYSLSHSIGAVLDSPDAFAVCAIGDGEAETGALSASWQSSFVLDPVHDGAVMPILHLNGYKIANPTVLGRCDDRDVGAILRGYGWDPIHVAFGTSDPHPMVHRRLAGALDEALTRIRRRQADARSSGGGSGAPSGWPVVVLRSPKGWTGPDIVDGRPVEGTWRSHQVPVDDVGNNEQHRRVLETWMRSYRSDELFFDDGRPRDEVVGWLPRGDRRLGANPRSNGGRRPVALPVLDAAAHGVPATQPGETETSATEALGRYLCEILEATADTRNFRIFGPDETASNRLDAVHDVTETTWQGEILDTDMHLGRHGRVMEILSEHLCQGWLEGYVLTGRHGVFSCYEAFASIIASMFNQHAKWLLAKQDLAWRQPLPSLNYVLTSHVWRQDHNGFSHQEPGFIDHVASKPSSVCRVYFPPDANCLLHVAAHCFASSDRINVMIAGKHPSPDWLDAASAADHVDRGFGVWAWAGNESLDTDGREGDQRRLDLVLACAGDVPTVEVIAAAQMLRDGAPDLAVRVVNVVDLMRLQSPRHSPHGASDDDFDEAFGTDHPVLFVHHGYPALIHRLTYDRRCHPNLHVRGFQEQGSTTTPFDMVVRNGIDRYSLVLDALGLMPARPAGATDLEAHARRQLARHVEHVTTVGDDLPEIGNWQWRPPRKENHR